MTVTLNRESIQVKRDLQRRIEDYVIKYCEALEENFKQYSINSYKRNIDNPTTLTNTYFFYYYGIINNEHRKITLQNEKFRFTFTR